MNRKFLAVAASLILFGAMSAPVAAQNMNGAGSTFVFPAMTKWAFEYGKIKSGVKVNYQSVGSGAGIAQYKAGTVDFGATDAPLSNKELGTMPSPTIHLPVTMGAEVLAYNIPGVGPGLKLSSDLIVDIYMGKITSWNDARIVKQNPGVNLPGLPITVVHRSDGSGTTYIFTDYLQSVSNEWKTKVGMGKTVNWPTGLGGRGNEGVAGLVKNSRGAIGYIELAFAVVNKLSYGPIKNRAGNYVVASIESTTAAAQSAHVQLAKDVRTSIVNEKGAQAYPISGMVYVLLSRTPANHANAKATLDFFHWVLGPGQALITRLNYAPLPASVSEMNVKALASIKL